MNILLIGSGGREHALAWKIHHSPLLDRLFIAPGNGGTRPYGEHPDLDVADHGAVVEFCRANEIGLVVIGPEAPLVAGLADDLREAGFATFGPSAAAAQLEGSKQFTKALCERKAIPTAASGHFTDAAKAREYITMVGAPIVVKADGLAAGKGVTVAMTVEEAHAAVDDCFDGSFGSAGAEVVIEAYLEGEEASAFFLCDGKNALPFGTAQDHKRAYDGDTGPNTGGMGAYSPAPVLTPELEAEVMQRIVQPTLDGMAEAGTPFSGVLYAGLMLSADGPQLIEYNVRFGDPECQVLMVRLESDLVPLLLSCANGDLAGQSAEWSDDFALTIVMAAKGYPGAYEKGTRITALDALYDDQIEVFHAGTEARDERIHAIGGRVLAVTSKAPTATEAQQLAYYAVEEVNWPEGFWRTDIGARAVEREKS
ncbi:phosphoribosylamine--glycine ligase [Ahrensia sp. R2A130]|uniref:phosphoribosylamine--glycine ligase n=1 Tax=Ahrensia sp. R2A130 TaxID=744979 RepID=UPI0001E0D100|nr:phosphoribosylamine--glycine ligase [Ahrensia sp. R2A130]EFL88845.1 phosphoribosylamine--glycine ligase [Ahrensia sp. R2A130]